jgi:hypothetical protein
MHIPNNPLLKNDVRSTIEAAYFYCEYLCILKSGDDRAHVGEWFQLETLRQALLSVRSETAITQKVD